MSFGTIIGMMIGVSIAIFLFVPRMVKRTKKRIRITKRFMDMVMTDYKVVMKRGILSGKPDHLYPTNVDTVFTRFYPELPLMGKFGDYELSELIEMVDWVIDPVEYLEGVDDAKKV